MGIKFVGEIGKHAGKTVMLALLDQSCSGTFSDQLTGLDQNRVVRVELWHRNGQRNERFEMRTQ